MTPRKSGHARVVVAAASVAVGVLTLAACTSAKHTASGSGSSKLLGIVSITANEYSNAQTIKGATAAAKAAGWTVQVIDAQGSATTANAAMQNLVSKKAGMIFNLVFPASAVGAGIAAARQAKIPVASWGGGPGVGIVADSGGGGPLAEPVIRRMISDLGERGEVLALNYSGGQVCIDRHKMFDKILASYPNIKVTSQEVNIPGFEQDAQKYANSWLASHPKGDHLAIWACWDGPAIGAVSALRAAHRTDITTYGQGGGPDAIAALKAGNLTATEWENAVEEGKVLFNTALEAQKAGSSWQPKTVTVPGVLLDRAGLPAFLTAHPDAAKS
jgi:ribose transport system substrate-binding protein